MSKRAEETALKLYPVLFSERNGLDDSRKQLRNACQYGYEQAEKDLSLTWEDIRHIVHIYLRKEPKGYEIQMHTQDSQGYYEEVLRRFKEYKNDLLKIL
jgi:hypothetical protein